MIIFPKIEPIAFSLGPLHVHWYGISYLMAVLLGGWLAKSRMSRLPGMTAPLLQDLIFAVTLGAVFGGKFGYALFYMPEALYSDPLMLIRLWEPGMSFHGGLLGVLLAVLLFAHKFSFSFWQLTDFIAPIVPIGLGLGRVANFVNGELWGSVTTLPWGVVFPGAGLLPRHPSQLYEALAEGPLLFLFLWAVSKQHRVSGVVSGYFAIAYSVVRGFVEFFRVPDPQYGYLAFGWLTMGQLLCLPLFLTGVYLVLIRGRA